MLSTRRTNPLSVCIAIVVAGWGLAPVMTAFGQDVRQPGPEARGEDGRRRGGPPPRPGERRPSPDRSNSGGGERKTGRQKYSLEQAVSDQAQLHTISFSGLAFITGDFGASTFMPPGKVCDFFGFQYMRDIDAAQKGHNPAFLNRVAGNVMKNLNDAQKKMFLDLAEEQSRKLDELARMRLPVIKAFHRQLEGDIPKDSAGLNKDAVIRYVGDVFAKDAELSYCRAEVMAKVAAALSPEQKAYFSKMKFGDFNTWPDVDEREGIRASGRGRSKLFNVCYMTYASEFFSWYAGSSEADTYFCPERHGTYFGGFYMKDMPAMGKRDFDISMTVTGDSGQAFLQVLSGTQRQLVTQIIDLQRKPMQEIIQVRRDISTELRKMLTGGQADRARVLALGRRYGELDGEVSWHYATAFAQIARTLTAAQRQNLVKLRNLPGYTSAPYYIYSEPKQDAPSLSDTAAFFFPPKSSPTGQGAK